MELVIAMAMIGIIFAAILPQFALIRNSWDVKQGTAEALQNGRVLMDHINRNLSKALRITAVSASSDTDGYIEFEDNAGSTLRYEIGANNYVKYGSVSSLEDLAGPVSSLVFTCYDACDLDNPLSPVTDVNVIRTVKVDATVINSGSLGQDKTFTTWAYLHSNGNNHNDLTNNTLFEFDTSDGQLPALVQIDATRYLCAYQRSSNGYAVVLTVDPSAWTITRGTPLSLENPVASGQQPALSQIDSDHYLCVYNRGGIGYAVVLTVSGTTITRGTRASLETPAASGTYPDLAQIDSTRYLCSYSRSNNGYAVVLTVNTGTWTITAGTPLSLENPAASGLYSDLAQIDSTHYLCAYSRSNLGNAVVLTVSGTTITRGTRFVFDAASGLYPSLAQIDSTHYLCAYTGSGSDGWSVVLIVTPGTWAVAMGTPYEFDTTNGQTTALAQMIDSARGRYSFLCSYRGPSNRAYAVVLNVNTSVWTITRETPLQFDTASTWPALAKINDGSCTDDWHYLCAYAGTGSDGWSVVLNYTELKP